MKKVSDQQEPIINEMQKCIFYSQMKQDLSQLGFTEFRYLASGSLGIILLAKQQNTNIRSVIKGYERNIFENESNLIQNEINMLKECQSSPYTISFFGEVQGKDFTYLIYNECQGTLSQIIKSQPNERLNELSTIKYAKDIAEGLQFIHSKNYTVGDIKLDNILIDYFGNAVIGDFGFSKKLDNNGYANDEYEGNFYFQAPECYDKIRFSVYHEEYVRRNIEISSKPSIRSEAFSLGNK